MDIKDSINNLDFEIEPDVTVQNETVTIQSDFTNLQEPVIDVRTKTPRKYKTTSFQALKMCYSYSQSLVLLKKLLMMLKIILAQMVLWWLCKMCLITTS